MKKFNRPKRKNERQVIDNQIKKQEVSSHETEKQINDMHLAEYEALFLIEKEFKERKSLYISAELHKKITIISGVLKDGNMSIGAYVENRLLNHFSTYKDEINTLNKSKSSKPI